MRRLWTIRREAFQAVKIKVGHADMNEDIARLTKVREAVGNDLKIMMDANQGMDVPSSVKLVNAVEHLNIHWFEEPVVNTDFDAMRQSTARPVFPWLWERESTIR